VPRDAVTYDNEGVAAVLDEIGDLLELKGENVFRAVTYRAVARAIRDLREPIAALVEQDRLAEIPKVGPSVRDAIVQLVSTGTSLRHQELKAAVPAGLITLLSVPGVGPATARIIYDNLKITTVDELEEAAKAHRLRELPKIQAKTEENILKSITSLKQRTGRTLVHHARAAATSMVDWLRQETGIEAISIAGSLRRYRETIGDVDLLVEFSAVGDDEHARARHRPKRAGNTRNDNSTEENRPPPPHRCECLVPGGGLHGDNITWIDQGSQRHEDGLSSAQSSKALPAEP